MQNEKHLFGPIISKVNRELIDGTDTDKILDFIFDGCLGQIPYDRIVVAILDKKLETLSCRWVKSRIPDGHLKKGLSFKLCDSNLKEVLDARQPRLINDLESYFFSNEQSTPARNAVADGLKSNLTCPLFFQGSGQGIVFFSSLEKDTYTSTHAQAFLDYADELSVVLEYERLQKNVAANQSREMTFSRAVHDIRSPLSVIKNCLELQTQMKDADTQYDESRTRKLIDRSIKSLLSLVNDLAEINTLEMSAWKLQYEPIELRPFLEEICDKFRLLCKMKEINFTCEFAESLVQTVKCDVERITQTLDNLVNNAIKFSARHSSIHFYVKCENEKLVFSITDSGQGIPQEEFSTLFKDFGRTSVRPTEGESTTGLGLSIVKRIVECHHGEVSVKSTNGKGSIFSFWIPCGTPTVH
jgi:signal transduction histidine kinase